MSYLLTFFDLNVVELRNTTRNATGLFVLAMSLEEAVLRQSHLYSQPQKFNLPPFHTKLGLMKNFAKLTGKKNSRGFTYLQKKFPNVSEAKPREGIFVGPQIRELLGDVSFQQVLTPLQLNSWLAFK